MARAVPGRARTADRRHPARRVHGRDRGAGRHGDHAGDQERPRRTRVLRPRLHRFLARRARRLANCRSRRRPPWPRPSLPPVHRALHRRHAPVGARDVDADAGRDARSPGIRSRRRLHGLPRRGRALLSRVGSRPRAGTARRRLDRARSARSVVWRAGREHDRLAVGVLLHRSADAGCGGAGAAGTPSPAPCGDIGSASPASVADPTRRRDCRRRGRAFADLMGNRSARDHRFDRGAARVEAHPSRRLVSREARDARGGHLDLLADHGVHRRRLLHPTPSDRRSSPLAR